MTEKPSWAWDGGDGGVLRGDCARIVDSGWEKRRGGHETRGSRDGGRGTRMRRENERSVQEERR